MEYGMRVWIFIRTLEFSLYGFNGRKKGYVRIFTSGFDVSE